MRVQNNTILILFIICLPILIMTPIDVFAACIYQPDAPDCPCFDSNGVWDPVVAAIQDVAIETLGTRESCACPGTDGCDWMIGRDDPFTNGGKPYYQIVLGCNAESCAESVSWALSTWGPCVYPREAWCSETISYWHREAAIPYPEGYWTCGWHCDWQNHNVGALRTWYINEEDGGRGRWIDPCDVDYENYVLGVTVPVPGAYVGWRTFDDFNDTWVADGLSHSLMINEMWIHEAVSGTAFKIEVTLLEGNSGNKVKNTRHWDDVLSLTPQGSEWIPNTTNKKIYGFGVDLNSRGEPIYDESRLYVVTWPYAKAPPTRIVAEKDPVWEQFYEPYLPALSAYARLMRQAGEPNVICSSAGIPISGIPNGGNVQWYFPQGLPGGLEVDIDLLDVHPLPIKGLELWWDSNSLPPDYRVQYADADQQYRDAIVPQIPGPGQAPPGGSSLPVPAVFTTSGDGAKVRYVKVIFTDAFERDAILRVLRFRYYQGPLADSEVCSFALLGDLDGNCSVDFRDVALMAGNWLVDCLVNPNDPACISE